MTAAQVFDVIGRLPDCAGQAADAASACTQAKMKDAPKCQSQNVQIFGYVFHDRSGPNLDQTLKTLWFLLNEMCTDTLWERQFEKVLLELEWEKVPNWEFLFVHRKQGFIFSVYVVDVESSSNIEDPVDPLERNLYGHLLAGLLWERQF